MLPKYKYYLGPKEQNLDEQEHDHFHSITNVVETESTLIYCNISQHKACMPEIVYYVPISLILIVKPSR